MHSLRSLVQLGKRLHEAWQSRRKLRDHGDHQWNNVTHAWSQLLVMRRRLQFADERGFTHCLPSVQEDYRWQLDEMSRLLQPLREFRGPPAREPGLGDWINELRSLEEEFGELVVDDKRSVLRVTTESITLKDVGLGPFAIEMVWTRLGEHNGSLCFDLIALQPNPATGRDEVTHPHVNDGELCAGDAATPIERALNEGRISDAFLLIRSVLTTYNARSAFVPLAEWDGMSCGDCGGRMHREEGSSCHGCERDLCESCSSHCRSCDATRCGDCLNTCDGCRDYCCSGCLEEIESGRSACSSCRGICADCSTVLLQSDLDENGVCPACAEPEEIPPTTPPIEEPAHAT